MRDVQDRICSALLDGRWMGDAVREMQDGICSAGCAMCGIPLVAGWASVEREVFSPTPTVSQLPIGDSRLRSVAAMCAAMCTPETGRDLTSHIRTSHLRISYLRTSYLSDTLWIVRTSGHWDRPTRGPSAVDLATRDPSARDPSAADPSTGRPSIGDRLSARGSQQSPGSGAADDGAADDELHDERVTVFRRTEAEALRPQNGNGMESPDGFDARRFRPSGRRLWMFDSGYSDKEEAAERARRRVRADDEVSVTLTAVDVPSPEKL